MSSIQVIIFSKDRPLQLDGTLRSFFLHAEDAAHFRTAVLFRASNSRFAAQYEALQRDYSSVTFVEEQNFKEQLLSLLGCEKVLFLVDDNIFTHNFSLAEVAIALDQNPTALGFSLRLGLNTTFCYPLNKFQALPTLSPVNSGQARTRIFSFAWQGASCDFGYPLEVSSSVYRVAELSPLLQQLPFNHPNSLEGALAAHSALYAAVRPQLLCFEQGVTFCNPINKVQSVAPDNRAGEAYGASSDELLAHFENGQRLDVAKYAGHIANACHQEVPLQLCPYSVPQVSSPVSPAVPTSVIVNDNPPLISVVIPCYKQGHLLKDAVESVVAQTYPNWECIIVNDGSPDNTSEVARQLIASHPKLEMKLIEKDNEGLAEARNTAIAEASGEWILPLDSDDKFSPRMMERTLQVALGDSAVNVVSTYVQCFGASNDMLMVNPYTREHLLRENVFTYASLYKRVLWERFGGYPPVVPFGAEDYNFWVTCSPMLNPRLIAEPHFLYRKHQNASMVDAVISHQNEVYACVHTCHSDKYEVAQLLHDHEVLASMQEDTKSVIDKHIAKFPRHSVLYLWRGLYHDGKGMWRQARRDFEMAAVLSAPHDWQPWFRLVLVNNEQGYSEQAAACAREALKRAPTFPFKEKLEQVCEQASV